MNKSDVNIVIPFARNYLNETRPGGIETYIRQLIPEIISSGYNIILLGIGNKDQYFNNNMLHLIPVVRERKKLNSFDFFIALLKNRRKLNLPRSSVIIANREEYCLPFLFPIKSHPVIITEHGSVSYALKKEKRKFFHLIYVCFVEYLTLKFADKVIFVSEEWKDYFLNKYPWLIKKSIVIPIGVDTKKFHILDKEKMRKKHGFDEDDNIILYVGRLGKEKGIDIIMKSFRKLKIKYPNAKLVLAGDGKEKDNLEKLVNILQLRDIIFFGALDHNLIPEIMNCADVLVICSEYEAGPLVAIEALACGIPVVSPNVGRIKEYINNDLAGKIVERNEKNVFEGIDSILKNKTNKKYVEKACRDSALRFGFDLTAKNTISTYLDVIKS